MTSCMLCDTLYSFESGDNGRELVRLDKFLFSPLPSGLQLTSGLRGTGTDGIVTNVALVGARLSDNHVDTGYQDYMGKIKFAYVSCAVCPER